MEEGIIFTLKMAYKIKTTKKSKIIPNTDENTKEFFRAEIRNEQNGGISPSTLYSALDSLNQYPDDYFEQDFKVNRKDEEKKIKALISIYGKNKPLSEFL